MIQEQKIIKNKLGLLKLAETLGSVSQACCGISSDGDQSISWIGTT